MQQSEEENIRLGKNILYNRNEYMQSLNLCVVESPHVEMLLVLIEIITKHFTKVSMISTSMIQFLFRFSKMFPSFPWSSLSLTFNTCPSFL